MTGGETLACSPSTKTEQFGPSLADGTKRPAWTSAASHHCCEGLEYIPTLRAAAAASLMFHRHARPDLCMHARLFAVLRGISTQ